ncbi:MAG: hypothetical protein H6622_15270 [Halobacteriovoraceae bacterium]|nr:hypothetical protein [Halobacteriovoraceae bacterium]
MDRPANEKKQNTVILNGLLYAVLSSLILYLLPQISFSLELDEKLTVRFLDISESKKTVLLNRGIEDGLVEGDHAKFFLTTGILARGVVVKVSPSRSIWSLYRVVDPNEISQEKVVNIKITSPVKITEDPTKTLNKDANPLGESLPGMSKEEVAAMMNDGAPIVMSSGMMTDASLEIYGHLGLQFFGAESDYDNFSRADGESGSLTFVNLTGGIEKYFETKDFYRSISIDLYFQKTIQEMYFFEGDKINISTLELGAGLSYHFFNDAFSFGRPILYFRGSVGRGNGDETFSSSLNNIERDANYPEDYLALSFGIGAKYYLASGWGARAFFDYYRRGEAIDDSVEEYTYEKYVQGFRWQIGVSYRF